MSMSNSTDRVEIITSVQRRRRWVVCLRLPEELHRRLMEAAADHMWDLKAEIISRLQASFRSRSYDF